MKIKIAKLTAVLLTAVVLLLTTSTAALAVGIGVTPGKLNFNIEAGDSESQTLYVNNPESGCSEFEIYTEGANEEWFNIEPASFTLASQEQKGVEITISPPPSAAPQEYNLSICIVSRSPDSDLIFGAGVKVQTHVQITGVKAHSSSPITEHPEWIAFIGFAISAVLALGIGIVLRKRRKAKHV